MFVDSDGEIVKQWREKLSQKYTKLPGIRSLHDFVVVQHLITKAVVLRTRELCYTGPFVNKAMTLVSGVDPSINAIPTTETYKATNSTHELKSVKKSDLQQMYSKFIPEERWLAMLR